MHNLEAAFLADIKANPHDWLPRLVFADWLEEQGDPRAELIRLSHDLTRLKCEDRSQKEARLQELREAGVQWPTPKLENGLGMEFVLIPPGEFLMGSPEDEAGRNDDERQVEVSLSQSFYFGRYVVTQKEWQEVMGTTPWKGKHSTKQGSRFPATFVSWNDVTEFCLKLTQQELVNNRLVPSFEFALPTEARWEYACRAGTTSQFSFAGDYYQLTGSAWCSENAWEVGQKYPHQVGSKKPNPWWLFDMHGNVNEWCQDWYRNPLPGGESPIARTENIYRIRRGGSWSSFPWACRSAFRGDDLPEHFANDIGFRVACVPVD